MSAIRADSHASNAVCVPSQLHAGLPSPEVPDSYYIVQPTSIHLQEVIWEQLSGRANMISLLPERACQSRQCTSLYPAGLSDCQSLQAELLTAQCWQLIRQQDSHALAMPWLPISPAMAPAQAARRSGRGKVGAEEAFRGTTKQSDLVPCLCKGHRQHLVFSLKGLHRALDAQIPHLKG